MAPTATMTPALRLPAEDGAPGSGRGRIALALPDAPPALLVAAFAAWLGRISGQDEVPLRAIQITAGGARRADEVALAVAGASGHALAAALATTWRGPPAPEPPAPALAAVTLSAAGLADAPAAALHLALAPGAAALDYDGERYRAQTAARFAAQLATLAAALVASPDADVAHLPLVPPAESAWLAAAGAGGPRAIDAELAPARFARIAAATPDAIAVRFRAEQLTYGELAARTHALAAALVARGAVGERVAVCLEPGLDIAPALLGALAAGAAYVPLDPSYPRARVHAILALTRPRAIVTRRALADRLELATSGAPVLALDDELPPAPGAALPALAPEHAAYVYFTSGTTGAPKGVVGTHGNLAFYLQAARDRYALGATDAIPAIARFGFSISLFELLSPLTSGGALHVLAREEILEPAQLARALAGVTVVHAGPSLLRHLVPYLEQHPELAGAAVRHASSGGDVVPPELLARLAAVYPRAEVFVIYGSSEVSCMGCTYPFERGAPPPRPVVGRPFPGVAVRVRDAAGAPVPIGVVGEIQISGAGVAAGYLDRPELTAERFVEEAGVRWYRMGDLGRWSAAGWLEICGRDDYQIKIRGMRVELAEIDLHLRRAPGVADGAAIARPGPGGEPSIVAFVVLAAPPAAADPAARTAQLAAIRRALAEAVPDYMLPAQYVAIAALPLNHNLKLDRAALPALAATAAATTAAPARPPVSASEQALAAIWRDVLGVPAVSLDDNFFELGGDSLLALELILRAERQLGVTLDGMDVLRESLALCAAACDRQLGRAAHVAPSPAAPRDAVRAFYFGPDAALYGVLHGVADASPRIAALIVPPLGQERVRTAFVLGRLARQLAAAGTPVLRFDLFGQGDSLGSDREATPARWLADIRAAAAELNRRAPGAALVAVGVRLGGTLLAAAELPAARLVLWDPVARGARYHDELALLHADYVRTLQHLRLRPPWRRGPRAPVLTEELLGTTLSAAALRELHALALPARGPRTPPLGWLATTDPREHAARFAALVGDDPASRFETLALDLSWREIGRLEDVVPDLGISRALAALVTEPG